LNQFAAALKSATARKLSKQINNNRKTIKEKCTIDFGVVLDTCIAALLNGRDAQQTLHRPVDQMDVRVGQLCTDGPQCGTNTTSVETMRRKNITESDSTIKIIARRNSC